MVSIFAERLIIGIIALVAVLIYAEVLFKFASENNKIGFSLLFLVGMLMLLKWLATMIIGALLASEILTFIMGLLVLSYIVLIGVSLFEQAGNNEREWYYSTLVFSFPVALVYQFVKK